MPRYRPTALLTLPCRSIPLARCARTNAQQPVDPFLNKVNNSIFPSILLPYSYSRHSPSLLNNTMSISSAKNPSNLITIRPIKSSPRGHSHLLSFHLLNSRNFKMKSSRFLDYTISEHLPDIVAVTKT